MSDSMLDESLSSSFYSVFSPSLFSHHKVELLDCLTKSSIDVGLIDFFGVDKFNRVVDLYLI